MVLNFVEVYIDCYATPCKADVQTNLEHLRQQNVVI